MKAKLKIRDFGPIRDCELDISKYTMLIGPQGAGKSTIAKVMSVIHEMDFLNLGFLDDTESLAYLQELLDGYRIAGFYNRQKSYWSFENEALKMELVDGRILLEHKVGLTKSTSRMGTYYIPAERIALPMIDESLFELTASGSALPKYFLDFGKDFTVARRRQKIFSIPQLGVEFEHVDGRNLVAFAANFRLGLDEMSSAVQANLPLLVILQYPEKKAGLFVVEELELHGFPLLQKRLLYYVTERMRHPKLENAYLILPTHSPYLLSAANNLLFAAKVAEQDTSGRDSVAKIIPENSWMRSEEFSAYYIEDGRAMSVIDRETGLIQENALDTVSEDLAGEFDSLMALYKKMKQ